MAADDERCAARQAGGAVPTARACRQQPGQRVADSVAHVGITDPVDHAVDDALADADAHAVDDADTAAAAVVEPTVTVSIVLRRACVTGWSATGPTPRLKHAGGRCDTMLP